MRGIAFFSFLGISSLALFTSLPDKSWLFSLSLFSLVLVAGLLRLHPLIRKSFLYLICFFLSFSYACYAAHNFLEQQLPQALEGRDLEVLGYVHDVPENNSNGVSFIFELTQLLSVDGQPSTANLQGLVRLTAYANQHTIPKLQAGEQWRLVLRLKRPHSLRNIGGVDYEKWLFAQRVIATGYVKQHLSLEPLSVKSLSIDRLREQISTAMAQGLAGHAHTGLIQGLAVAVTNGISPEQWAVLQATGTGHLVSISGLHIAMVASLGFIPIWLIWRLFPSLYLYWPIRLAGAMLGSVFASLYALLAGFNIPTQRSLVMVLVLMLGLVLRKRIPFSRSLATAILFVLILDPFAPLSVGFWLSFGAISLLALLSLHQPKIKWWRILFIQFALSVFLIPINAAFFANLPVYAPLANLVAIPWVTLLVVPLILLGVLCLPISNDLANLAWWLAAKALDLLWQGLSYLAQLPNAQIYFPDYPWYWLALAVFGVVLILLPKGLPGRWLGLVCFIPLLTWQPLKPNAGEFRLTVLDVGQSLATTLQTSKHTLIIDTGSKSVTGFDMGEIVVTPWLRSQQIQQIDALVVSHQDNDHRGGAGFLLEHFPVEHIFTNTSSHFEKSIPPAKLEHCVAGMAWEWDGVKFEFLHPTANFVSTASNNTACVLHVSNEAYAALLPSDIEKPIEQHLLAQTLNLQADVLLVPHHGSKTSSSKAFIEAVHPQLAVVSSGYLNRFHHPHTQVLERYQQQGIAVLNTVNAGAIEINFPNNASSPITLDKYRQSHAHFWNHDQRP